MNKRNRCLIIVFLLITLLLCVSGCTSDTPDTSDTQDIYMDENLQNERDTSSDKDNTVNPNYVPSASFDENKVSWPRLEIYVYPEDAYYYISVEPGLAERITNEISNSKKRTSDDVDDTLGYTIAFSPEPSSWNFLYQNINGEYFWGDTQISTDSGNSLIERVCEATGWELEGNPIMVEDISEISIYLGAECLETITNSENIEKFETYLHQAHALGYVSKTPNYRIEICCKLHGNETVSFVADANEDYVGIWVPPCYYYECVGTELNLLNALGMDKWPEKVRETDRILDTDSAHPYPQEILDQLFNRVGGQIKAS